MCLFVFAFFAMCSTQKKVPFETCYSQVLDNLDKDKYTVPEPFPYEEVRQLFLNPEVTDPESVDVSPLAFPSACVLH